MLYDLIYAYIFLNINFFTFRWEPRAVNHVPEYLKDFYLKLLKTCKDFEDELEPHEKYRIPYLQEEVYISC